MIEKIDTIMVNLYLFPTRTNTSLLKFPDLPCICSHKSRILVNLEIYDSAVWLWSQLLKRMRQENHLSPGMCDS